MFTEQACGNEKTRHYYDTFISMLSRWGISISFHRDNGDGR
jgi:hypothetical protein